MAEQPEQEFISGEARLDAFRAGEPLTIAIHVRRNPDQEDDFIAEPYWTDDRRVIATCSAPTIEAAFAAAAAAAAQTIRTLGGSAYAVKLLESGGAEVEVGEDKGSPEPS